MYNYEDIKEVHLEITDKCNASCPMCGRNKNGGEVNQWLPLTELSLSDCKAIFPSEFISQLLNIYMCGNFGDPIIAKDTLNIYDYFRKENSNVRLEMHTNGSARKVDWWQNLASVFGTRGVVTYGIDGLSDTNHLYRRGTDFEKIIENAESFINAGGRAQWDYIVFKHNEHQIEEAREFAKKMRFERFTVKKTGRFFNHGRAEPQSTREVWDNDGNVLYHLEQPSIEFQNQSILDIQKIKEDYGSMAAYWDQTQVKCKALDRGLKQRFEQTIPQEGSSIFISADGYVFPCCWTANQIYNWGIPKESSQISRLINATGGIEKINAKNLPVKEIVETSDFFQAIKDSWSLENIESGKLTVCSKHCGGQFDVFNSQYN